MEWYASSYTGSQFKAKINPLSTNPTKWPITLKQFVGKLPTDCLSVFDHFVKLALKGLKAPKQRQWILILIYVLTESTSLYRRIFAACLEYFQTVVKTIMKIINGGTATVTNVDYDVLVILLFNVDLKQFSLPCLFLSFTQPLKSAMKTPDQYGKSVFKVIGKVTRITSLMSLWCLCCWLWTSEFDFEQINIR